MKFKARNFTIFGIVFISCGLLNAKPQNMLPRFVDTKLGGSNLLKPEYHADYDPKTKYHLWAQHEFDGGSNTIFIAPHPAMFGYSLGKDKPRHRAFPLVSGREIKIGDSVRVLRRKLGKPKQTKREVIMGVKRRVDIYEHNNNKKESAKRVYEAHYVSLNGKIPAIRFSYYRGTW